MAFANASNIVVSGGTFTSTYKAVTVSSNSLALLSSKVASGAFHNSAERFDPPKCHPNTREAILQTILNWLDDPAKSAQIMWIYGSAGVGKSAIAQSIAEMCFKTGNLAGSFFFGRGAPNRHTETFFISTLAYQIMQSFPEIRTSVLDAVDKDPQLFSLSLADQMEKLIIGPLNAAIHDDHEGAALRSRTATLFVVDGLDECDHPQAQRRILDVLSFLVNKVEIPVSILISCRPEQVIRDAFNEEPLTSLTTRINLDNISDDTDVDIKTFLLSEFQTMKLNHPAKDHFPPVWPSENEMTELMLRSRGHFIYASTVIKYIGSRRHSPITRLSYILQQSIPATDTPFAALDALYQQILLGADDLETAFKIIATLLLGNSSLLPPTAATIELLHCFQPGTVNIALCDLHSIVYVPGFPDDNLRMYHASFSDFLFDEARSGRSALDQGAAHVMLATAVLKLSTSSIRHFHTSVLLCDHFDRSLSFTDPNLPLQNQFLNELYATDLFGLLSSSRDQAYAYWDEMNRVGQFLIDINDSPHPDHESDLVTHHLQFFIEWITLALSGPIRKFTKESNKLKEANVSVDAILQAFQSSTTSLATTPEGRRRINKCCKLILKVFTTNIVLSPNLRDSNGDALININDYVVNLLMPVLDSGGWSIFRSRRAYRARSWASQSTEENEFQEMIARRDHDRAQASAPGWCTRTLRRLFRQTKS